MTKTELRILRESRDQYNIKEVIFPSDATIGRLYQQSQELAIRINASRDQSEKVLSSQIYAVGIIRLLQREVIDSYSSDLQVDIHDQMLKALSSRGHDILEMEQLLDTNFPALISPQTNQRKRLTVEEMLLLEVFSKNKAIMGNFPELFDSTRLKSQPEYQKALETLLGTVKQAPGVGSGSLDLFEFLCLPALHHPDSLTEQLEFILSRWKGLIGTYASIILRALDFIHEQTRPIFPSGGPGPVETLRFDGSYEEYEAFSVDSHWMPNVIMMAKSTLVWLDQLSKKYHRDISRVDQIPDEELDLLSQRGFTALWLIGLWERSPASKRIKRSCGNDEAEASAYSLKSYDIAEELGGWQALDSLRARCRHRGIRLASDMVPNHTGLDSDWVMNSPELFLQTDVSPFPSYRYEGQDLSDRNGVGIYLEDHYYAQTDAAVTFKRVDHRTGEVQYIYHGNDGTGMPWNDTAQLDYLNPKTRERVIETIIHVARNFPIIRFDAAMTLAKKHIQRLWYPLPGTGGDIPSRSIHGMDQQSFNEAIPVEFWREVVDRIAQEAPDTLLLAEAFWMMEGYFVRTLGMHRVYNSAFMNMLKQEEDRKYRDTIKNTIAFDPEILKRYVNFMNNPDEEPAVAQFGGGDKYFGVCTLLVTMPGLPMFGHGQIEGFREKYGMEFRRAYWNEKEDPFLVGEHYRRIFPLMKLRRLFSEAENFAIYDLKNGSEICEHVYAYTNQHETEHALVLYNNSFERASGWMKRSAPMLKRSQDGTRALETVTIAQALGLRGNEQDFFICRGFHDNRYYIRSSQETAQRGLFISLDGYQTQVFLDVYEVEDTNGLYAQLCEVLGGSGTDSIERDIRRLCYSLFHIDASGFYQESTLEQISGLLTGDLPDPTNLEQSLSDSLMQVSEHWHQIPTLAEGFLPGTLSEDYTKHVSKALGMMQTLAEKREENLYLDNSLYMMPELPVILSVWILLSYIYSSYGSTEQLPDLGVEFLLEEHIQEPLRKRSVPSAEAERLSSIPAFMRRFEGWYSLDILGSAEQEGSCIERLLKDEVFCRLIGANWHESVQWYNKEAFGQTIWYLYLAEILYNEASIEDRRFNRLIGELLQRELTAEYKTANLI